MKQSLRAPAALALAALSMTVAGCSRRVAAKASEPADDAPPQVEEEQDGGIIKVEHPEQFPLVTASAHRTVPALQVTGLVSADVSRNVPVVSMSSGRIVEVRARLGDVVHKGQVLMRVQSADLSDAFSTYRQAVADEKLAVAQLDRSKALFEKGGIARKDLEVAVQTAEKADVAVDAAVERLRVMGADKAHPTAFVDVTAPVDGVITDQQVTAASGTQGLASPNAFTISDLSRIWVVCDVYEDQLSYVNVGDTADIRLNAYPTVVLHGSIDNIGAILDPNIRTAKVRIEVENPGIMRLGMFVQATFHGRHSQIHSIVPTSAVLHLHDRDWVYLAQHTGTFRRVEVQSGQVVPRGQQEILSGIRPGDRVAANPLFLDSSYRQ